MRDDSYDILLVEDDPTRVARMRAAFAARSEVFRVRVAGDLATARRELARAVPTLVVADVALRDGNAVELIPTPLGASYPVIVLADRGDERAAVEVMRAGALDYVVKSEATLTDIPHIAEHAIAEWRMLADRFRAREAERAAGARLQAILGAVPDILVELDGAGVITWLNEAGAAFFGPDALGRSMQDYAQAPACDFGVGTCEQEEWARGPRRECWHRRHDGEPRLLAWWSRQIEGNGGAAGALLASARDITDTRRLQGQFLHAQKLEAVGALASGIAHDFNNLLMGIRGCADMCLRLLDERDEARALVEDIKIETGRGASLTRQLLTFARKREVELEVIDLNALVAQSEIMLRRLLGAGIHLRVQLAAADGRLRADPGQLEQVLWNLVINARHAMPAGGHLTVNVGEVTLDAESAGRFGDLAPGAYLTLTVSDSGRGMDQATLTRVFEPFFTTKEEGEGTGLGLPTARDIVKGHGGDIQLASEIGAGTTVRVYLPRGVERLSVPEDTGEYPASLRGHETVLVVEDEPLVRRTVVHYLERWGYQVIEAAAGKDALRLFEQPVRTIDLLLVDVVLPGPSGAEVARQVGRLRPSLPVLHMSAYPLSKLVREGLLPAGAVALQKPFTEDDLLLAVRRSLAHPPCAGEPDSDAWAALRRGTLLLVEDHAPSRLAIKVLFEDEGYRVLSAADGGTALQLCREHDGGIDVLLTDVGLPDVGVDVFVEQLRELKAPSGIICMSGRCADDPQVRHATSMRGVTFVEKPIDFTVLSHLVEQMVAAMPAEREPRRAARP